MLMNYTGKYVNINFTNENCILTHINLYNSLCLIPTFSRRRAFLLRLEDTKSRIDILALNN